MQSLAMTVWTDAVRLTMTMRPPPEIFLEMIHVEISSARRTIVLHVASLGPVDLRNLRIQTKTPKQGSPIIFQKDDRR